VLRDLGRFVAVQSLLGLSDSQAKTKVALFQLKKVPVSLLPASAVEVVSQFGQADTASVGIDLAEA
jgi:hypothetical protein